MVLPHVLTLPLFLFCSIPLLAQEKSSYPQTFPEYDASELGETIGRFMGYSNQLNGKGLQGEVIVSFLVDSVGKPSNIETLRSSSPDLTEYVRYGIRVTRFQPATYNNQPIRYLHQLKVEFLRKGKENEPVLLIDGVEVKIEDREIIDDGTSPVENFLDDDEESTYVPAPQTPPHLQETDLVRYLIYPSLGREKNIEGKVSFTLQVEKDGSHGKPILLQTTSPLFIDPVLKALDQVSLTPARHNDKPVVSRYSGVVHFRIKQTKKGKVEILQIAERKFERSPESSTADSLQPLNPDDYPLDGKGMAPATFDYEVLASNMIPPESEGVGGIISVKIFLDETGRILSTQVLSTDHPSFISAALNAINKTAFSPAIKEGKIIKSSVVITINFTQ